MSSAIALAPEASGARSSDQASRPVEELASDFALPCHTGDPDLWFAEAPAELERAKQLCGTCPIRAACLAGALERGEPWGVWGGAIFERGEVIARKRPRGRPRKHPVIPSEGTAA